MPASLLSCSLFSPSKGRGRGAYSHPVTKVILHDQEDLPCYCKTMENLHEASFEAIAEEFFRLIIPEQPHTFIAYCNESNEYYLLSEEILGFTYLPYKKQQEFNEGKYPGLGQIIIGALFLQESDLKNGNIGIDRANKVKKIDGDHCFYNLKHPRDPRWNPITPDMLKDAPFPTDNYPDIWLDIVIHGEVKQSKIIDWHLRDTKAFREEICQGILKILLLTDGFLQDFANSLIYHPTQAKAMTAYLINKRKELKKAALSLPFFQDYLVSDVVDKTTEQHLAHMTSFTVQGDYLISPREEYDLLTTEVEAIKKELVLHASEEILFANIVNIVEDFYQALTIEQVETQLKQDLSDLKMYTDFAMLLKIKSPRIEQVAHDKSEELVSKADRRKQELQALAPKPRPLNRSAVSLFSKPQLHFVTEEEKEKLNAQQESRSCDSPTLV